LPHIRSAELYPEPAPQSRATDPDVHGDQKGAAADNPHQLAHEGLPLHVKAPQYIASRNGLIELGEVNRKSSFPKCIASE
jgi:hypothetical protein